MCSKQINSKILGKGGFDNQLDYQLEQLKILIINWAVINLILHLWKIHEFMTQSQVIYATGHLHTEQFQLLMCHFV